MKQYCETLQRVITAFGIEDDPDQLTEILGISHSTIRTWNHRKSVPKAQLKIVALKTGYSYEWLLTGVGDKVSKSSQSKHIKETPDEIWDEYQPRADSSSIAKLIEYRVYQAEIILKTISSQYSRILDDDIQKYFRLIQEEKKQRSTPANTGTDPHGR